MNTRSTQKYITLSGTDFKTLVTQLKSTYPNYRYQSSTYDNGSWNLVARRVS